MIKNVNKSVKGRQKAKNDDRGFCKTYNEPLLVNKLSLVAIAAVADGVGGLKGGDKASAIAVKELESRAERHKGFGSLKDIDEFFKNIYKEINQIILKEQENQNFPNMCTTLVSAGLFGMSGTEQCYLFTVNCGDSPLLCIDTDRDEIELLSTIHHTGNHLTQYLGKRNLEIHNSYCQCPKNGFILLCSDGLTGNMASSPCVSKEEIKKYLVETKNIDEASEILTRLAQYKGSSDDISVAILEMGKPKRVKPKRLTPIASRRYRAIAERLVYAGILLSMIAVFYYKSESKNDTSNSPKVPASQATSNIKSSYAEQGKVRTDNAKSEQSDESINDKEQGVSESPQIKNNTEEPKASEDKKDNEKNGVGISDSKLGEGNTSPDAKGEAEDSATKNGESESESMNKEAFKPIPDTSENQKKEEVSKKGNNKELNKPTDDKTWLMIKVKCENKPLKKCEVYIDGKLYDKTGNNGELKIETYIGEHTLRVEKINYKSWSESINLQSGRVTKDIELLEEAH